MSTNDESKFGHPVSERRNINGGDQWKFKFDNGYGASVVCHDYSYGGPVGLYELAVLGTNGHLTYETPITDDVIGYLDDDQVGPLLARIAALPKASA